MLEDGESTRAALTPDPGAVTVITGAERVRDWPLGEGTISFPDAETKAAFFAALEAAPPDPVLLPAGYFVTLLEAAPPSPDSFAQGLVVPRTPALDKLWTRIDTYTPSRSMPDREPYLRPTPRDIAASRECTACSGTGQARRTRERSAVPPTPNAERQRRYRDKRRVSGRLAPPCCACDGNGWVALDAKPKIAASDHGAGTTQAKQLSLGESRTGLNTALDLGALHGPCAPFEFIADAELRRWRALRALTRRSRDVGEAWARRYEDGSLAPLPLTSVWPLTEAGRLAFALRASTQPQLWDAANEQAVALLEQAEAEARAALASQGLGVRSTATLESESE